MLIDISLLFSRGKKVTKKKIIEKKGLFLSSRMKKHSLNCLMDKFKLSELMWTFPKTTANNYVGSKFCVWNKVLLVCFPHF